MKGHSGTGEMKDDITQAVGLTSRWLSTAVADVEALVPADVLASCHGICFLNFIKAGFIFAGTLGTGFVLTKLDKGLPTERWSAPSAITSGGVGWGALIGAQKVHNVVILNTEDAKNTFTSEGKVKFGGDMAIAAGPVGRRAEASVEAGNRGVVPTYAYSYAKGMYAGIGLDGAVVGANPAMNKTFYGRDIAAAQLLGGEEDGTWKTHPELKQLYDNLDKAAKPAAAANAGGAAAADEIAPETAI